MAQNTDAKPTPVIRMRLADPSVPFPRMTGGEPCKQADPDFWFPEQGVNAGPAKRACVGCPVQAACAAWAIANPHLTAYGVWGGMSLRDRNDARSNTTRSAA
ncbi:WhiB family transcriptional regulator [Streptomyces sp. NPDC004579]|uniref:WhiB family transcriptional regulator n=1 Tax=Streptomyces sp. NPDC004579 TaxID=3154667 RepID=UPI0033BEA898